MSRGRNGRSDYPAFEGERIPLLEAAAVGGGIVTCRWFTTYVTDESGRLPILGTQGTPVVAGDWVSGRLVPEGLGWTLSNIRVHAENRLKGSIPDEQVFERGDILRHRRDALRSIREYFDGEGFLEVETPYRVRCPAVEPYLEAVPSGDRFLITSPELHMKRLLGAGFERVYQIARVFRGEESGRRHLEEFTLLEWYRAWSGPSALMDDCEQLVRGLCRRFGRRVPPSPFERLEYQDLFKQVTGLDPFAWTEDTVYLSRLRRFARARGLEMGADCQASDLVEGIFAHVVEPFLGEKGPVFIEGFPPWAAVLSRVRNGRGRGVADRFELYLDGLEVANAYHELTDPDLNHERLLESEQKRLASGRERYPRDPDFSRALEAGIPPSAGIALGIDRLMMWLLNIGDIRDTVAFI